MYKIGRHATLQNISMVVSSGAKDDVIPGTDAQTYRKTEMQT